MDTTNAPQIIEHLSRSLNFTPFDTRWIPGTAKFILVGQTPRSVGVFQIFQLNKKELLLTSEFEKGKGYKCLNLGASNGSDAAVGDFGGSLSIIDLETRKETWTAAAHEGIVNCVDGIGGGGLGFGAPEIVTGGRDGCVRLWDPRQSSAVVSLEPADKAAAAPDAWAVAFGNSYNAEERVIAAGYDNGDVKLFDLRTNSLRWDTNLRNGVCGLEFDRKDILMNKIVATTLESRIHLFDLRTFNAEHGYASLSETGQVSTIWGVRHLPQNRDLFATLGGNGALNLYKYNYPPQRAIQDAEGRQKGVVGSIELLNSSELGSQPIASLDWHADKVGLAVLAALDQTCRVMIVTRLNLY